MSEQLTEDRNVVEELYNQAANEGTLVDQEGEMGKLASEAGTTLEALKHARELRNNAAAEKAKANITELPHPQSAEDEF